MKKLIGVLIVWIIMLTIGIKFTKEDLNRTINSNENIIERYEDDKIKKLNIFLSNFSEVDFYNFSRDNYKHEQLIKFAIDHILANDITSLRLNEEHDVNGKYIEYINAQEVQNSIQKYFGFNVPNKSIENHQYNDGAYSIDPYYSEKEYPNFTQVREIYENDSILKIKGKTYHSKDFNSNEDNSWRYEPIHRNDSFSKDIDYLYDVEADIKLIHENGNTTYKLLNYKVNY